MAEVSMEQIVSLAKNRGFVFPGSEIYGGLANSWDYGPLGVELKNNIKNIWWRKFVRESPYNVGIDSSILMNPEVWVASGHVQGFSDPLIDCKSCKVRYRADQLIQQWANEHGIEIVIDGWTDQKLMEYMLDNNITCPQCGNSEFTNIRQFNLMFKTFQGVTADTASEIYLRPETAQGIFVNFKNVQRSTRKKIPFGIAQVGKSFRNEVTPGNFIFRIREFEQMELEFFCKPGTDIEWFKHWRDFCYNWLLNLGMKGQNLRLREHSKQELAHYSDATADIEYKFPFGWGELWGISHRTNFDLRRHSEHSKQELDYFDPATNEKYIPYCIEPSLGVDRVALAFLCDAYDEELLEDGDTRIVLRFEPNIAPIKLAVLPLSKKLFEPAHDLYRLLCKDYTAEYDDTGSIGKRYRRQDEIGTPYCITFDFDSLEDQKVTIRERDTMKQIRVSIKDELTNYLMEHLT